MITIRDPEAHRLATGGPARPSRPRLGHGALSFSIEKHSVLLPILYAAYTFPLYHPITPLP
jgi:hypothetical protein